LRRAQELVRHIDDVWRRRTGQLTPHLICRFPDPRAGFGGKSLQAPSRVKRVSPCPRNPPRVRISGKSRAASRRAHHRDPAGRTPTRAERKPIRVVHRNLYRSAVLGPQTIRRRSCVRLSVRRSGSQWRGLIRAAVLVHGSLRELTHREGREASRKLRLLKRAASSGKPPCRLRAGWWAFPSPRASRHSRCLIDC
jgi:hypothetical protein